MTGRFITFEGIEGSGKSTQIKRLAAYLTERGYTVDVTREPGGTPTAEAIRAILLDPANTALAPRTELLLYAAARAQHVAERIRPRLEAGHVVLCDRYIDSTTAYQGTGRALPEADVADLQAFATGGLKPDLTILLDLPAEDGLRRATRGEADRIERESVAFHQRVRDGFLAIAEAEPDRVRVLDGTQPPQSTANAIVELVQPLLDGAPHRT